MALGIKRTGVERALLRRKGKAARGVLDVKWFIREVDAKINFTMRRRVKVATELVKSKVVLNLSTPVVKTPAKRKVKTGELTKRGKARFKTKRFTRVTGRSKEGEFPHAETTHLMGTVFGTVKKGGKGMWDGFVGTPLSYGVILETRMKRSFLARTLNEQRRTVNKILGKKIKGRALGVVGGFGL